MRAALARADVVRVAEDIFLELGVVLHGDLDVDAVALLVHIDHVLMHQFLVLVQHLHELDDAALVVELLPLQVPSLLMHASQGNADGKNSLLLRNGFRLFRSFFVSGKDH